MHYAIGDVHGCYAELKTLLATINYNSEQDVLWFVGDLVNRGPDSLAVLRFIKTLPPSTRVVLGNHDLHCLAVISGILPQNSNDAFDSLLLAEDKDDLIHFLRHQPLFHYDEVLGVALVHAGIAPMWNLSQTLQYAKEVEQQLQGPRWRKLLQHVYGNTPSIWDEKHTGWSRYRVISNYLTRMRFVDKDGRMDLTLNTDLAKGPLDKVAWFDAPNRCLQDIDIVFGHWAALKGTIRRANVHAIDSGCIWGGALTALCLQTWERTQVASQQSVK